MTELGTLMILNAEVEYNVMTPLTETLLIGLYSVYLKNNRSSVRACPYYQKPDW